LSSFFNEEVPEEKENVELMKLTKEAVISTKLLIYDYDTGTA
jgi:hypothetical protein